jgi:ferredoxin, 2Fe-2S
MKIESIITINFIAAGARSTSATGRIGQSLMQSAVAGGINGIAADCGGLMTCATCHVFVQEPFTAQVGPPDTEEKNMLGFTAVPARANSRLSCQITLTAELDGLTVELPSTQY